MSGTRSHSNKYRAKMRRSVEQSEVQRKRNQRRCKYEGSEKGDFFNEGASGIGVSELRTYPAHRINGDDGYPDRLAPRAIEPHSNAFVTRHGRKNWRGFFEV